MIKKTNFVYYLLAVNNAQYRKSIVQRSSRFFVYRLHQNFWCFVFLFFFRTQICIRNPQHTLLSMHPTIFPYHCTFDSFLTFQLYFTARLFYLLFLCTAHAHRPLEPPTKTSTILATTTIIRRE